MHWLDELPRKLPDQMREQLRGYPDIGAAWSMCSHGPWLFRLGIAATHDRNARADLHDLAMELAVDVQGALDAHESKGTSDPVALALDFLISELRAAADGDGPELFDQRSKARPAATFDETVSQWRKKIADAVRERFPSPPG
jgi:hypothetical protein